MSLQNSTRTFRELSFAYCLDRSYLNISLGGPIFVYFRIGLDATIISSMIIVNVLLIYAVIVYRRTHRGSVRVSNSSATTKFVLMLSISDVLVGLCALLYLIPHYICNLDDFIRINKYLCTTKYVSSVFAAIMSNVSLVFIAVDRYIAIEYTLRYRIIMSRRVCHAMIAGQIAFSAATSSVLFFWNNWNGNYCDLEDIVPNSYIISLGITLHTAILILVVGIHIQLHRKASALNSRRSIMELRVSKETTKSLKSAKTVLLVAGVYFICWTPYTVCLLLRASSEATPLTDFLFQISFPLSIANSLINPFIYAWKNNEIQAALLWTLGKNMPMCLCSSVKTNSSNISLG